MNLIKSTQKMVEQNVKILRQAMALKSYRKLALNFLILTVNLLIIILYFTLSKATVVIIPGQEKIVHTLSIPIQTTAAPAVEVVRSQVISESISISETFPVSAVTVPAAASGEIIIRNQTKTRVQRLIASTQFSSPAGVIIRLKESISIGPGQSLTVPAYADQPGPEGEVEPGRFEIVKLKSDRDKIYGQVTSKFTGGTARVNILTEADYQKAQQEIEQKLRSLAQERIKRQYPPAQANDITLKVAKIASTAKVGDKNLESFTLTAQGEATLVTYDAQAALNLIKQDLLRRLLPDKILVAAQDESFTARPDAEGKNLEANLTAIVQPRLPDSVFNKQEIKGLNRAELQAHFAKITGIEDIEIKFWPFWVRSVPNLEDHVEIEIKKD